MVDQDGLPIRIVLSAGQASDKAAVAELIEGLPPARALVADRGYDAQAIIDLVQARGGCAHIPTQKDPNEDLSKLKPNPLTLVVSISTDLQLKLNQDNIGSVNDTGPLSQKLRQTFEKRKQERAFKPGMETRTDLPEADRIEKTVFVKAPRSLAYGEVVKVIDAIKGAGANPVGLQVDDLPQ